MSDAVSARSGWLLKYGRRCSYEQYPVPSLGLVQALGDWEPPGPPVDALACAQAEFVTFISVFTGRTVKVNDDAAAFPESERFHDSMRSVVSSV